MEKVFCGQCHRKIKEEEMSVTQIYLGKETCPNCLEIIYRTIEQHTNKVMRKVRDEEVK